MLDAGDKIRGFEGRETDVFNFLTTYWIIVSHDYYAFFNLIGFFKASEYRATDHFKTENCIGIKVTDIHQLIHS